MTGARHRPIVLLVDDSEIVCESVKHTLSEAVSTSSLSTARSASSRPFAKVPRLDLDRSGARRKIARSWCSSFAERAARCPSLLYSGGLALSSRRRDHGATSLSKDTVTALRPQC